MRADLIFDYYRKYHFQEETPEEKLKKALPVAFDMPPEKALEYLKSKGGNLITTSRWDELNVEAHHKAFTVAGMMSADILQDIYNHVEAAKEKGWTLDKFTDSLLPRLAQAGWVGAEPSRLKVIYETNMQMAYSQNQYKQQKLSADIYPFWQYTQIHRHTKNPEHAKLDGKVFRHDDPIWEKIYPPSEFGCKCSVVPLKSSEVEKVEDGDKWLKELDDKHFSISPLKAWKPDTKKYVTGIRKQLDKYLEKEPYVLSSKPSSKESGTDFKRLDRENIKKEINKFIDTELPDEFWKLLQGKTGFKINKRSSVNEYDATNDNIHIGLRKIKDPAVKKALIVHEIMHCGHYKNEIIDKFNVHPAVKKAYDEAKSLLEKNYKPKELKDMVEVLKKSKSLVHDSDTQAKIDAVLGFIDSLTEGKYNGYYRPSYFKDNKKYMEFLAFSAEYYFAKYKTINSRFGFMDNLINGLIKSVFEIVGKG